MDNSPFQSIATVMLMASFFYIWLQQNKVKFIRVVYAILTVTAIYFVWQPEVTNRMALVLGIGRGADLILYTWLVLSALLIVNLHLKMVLMKSGMTTLARKIALLEVIKYDKYKSQND